MCGILCLLNGVVLQSEVLAENGLTLNVDAQNCIAREACVDDFIESLKCRGPDQDACIDVDDYLSWLSYLRKFGCRSHWIPALRCIWLVHCCN